MFYFFIDKIYLQSVLIYTMIKKKMTFTLTKLDDVIKGGDCDLTSRLMKFKINYFIFYKLP